MSKEIKYVATHCGYIVLLGLMLLHFTRAETCILIDASNSYLRANEETYVNVGKYDIPELNDGRKTAEVSFKVLVDQDQTDGILFAIGNTPKFKYWEWRTKAVNTVFMVIEFVYAALSVLLKAEGTPHMAQMEIYRTYPTLYTISDGNWHDILVKQEGNKWTLMFDNITVSTPVKYNTDVNLFNREVFVGGRPGYLYWQFKGIIRNLHINRRPVNWATVKKFGRVAVEDCDSEVSQRFVATVSKGMKSTQKPPTRSTRSPSRRRNRNRGIRRWSRYQGR